MKSERFATLWNFPCCVGALDGKHVRIECPSHAGSLFFNYKHFHLIQLQAVVDADLMFIVIDVGEYGRNSDGAAFKTSDFGKALMNKELDLPNPSLIPGTDEEMPYHFVADEAYPLNLNIMRPFDGRNLNNTRRVFNQRLSRARKVVECAFGILSRKWEIFQRPLRVQVDNAETIVKAACALHNFVRARDGEMRPETSTEMDTMEAPSLRQSAGLSHLHGCFGVGRPLPVYEFDCLCVTSSPRLYGTLYAQGFRARSSGKETRYLEISGEQASFMERFRVLPVRVGYPHSTFSRQVVKCTTAPGLIDPWSSGHYSCFDLCALNGRVQCDKDQCPKLEGCHYILHEQMVCKGCKFKDKERKSGSSWNYKRNPCKQLSCRAGVVTISDVQCFTPCYRTLPPAPGTCCPRCEGCFFGGKSYSDGDSFQLPTDSCTTCKCQTGILVCERRQCPVLNCPPETIYQPDNECCPKCRDMRELFEAPDKLCYFAKQLYKQRKRFTPTKCAKCACKSFSNSSVSVCKTKTCPALNCPEEERAPLAGSQCCQVCVAKRTCQFGGETYKNREFWRPNICMTCSCEDGKTYCNRHKCNNSLWCPPGYRLQLSREQCCPTCVEHDAVCSVFGDPHYRTFDGLTYSFQGTCKYILAQPCKGKLLAGDTTKPRGRPRAYSLRKKSKMRNLALRRDDENYFMIKVRNGVRFSSGFAWTQMLVVLLAEHRISMLQGGVVKVNRHRIRRMPHTVPGQFTLTRAGGLVKLRTTIGLQVSWDGDSFVEVTVTTRLKFKVCGLCGSYNGVKADDLRGPDGRMYATGQEMGHAWRTGGTRACQSRPQLVASEPLCEQDAQARLRAHRVCSVFFGRAFSRCRKVVEVDVYVSSCITDMCDCPSGRYCACEAIRAYISQCDRAGLQVKWDSLSDFCHISQECSPDSRLVECAETCPGTCDRTGSDVPCPLSCIEACWCRDRAKVFHDGHCIKPSDCPAKGR
ncbi:hypothetical protein RRG08_034687 [Elysia crispata]|uniref:Uncharacterized protein n=1 Tax=Elysia crispata TaxID=231223 RepID=A0AAE1D7Z9_9GAST|nr:hypothetical protein RRG08_034687 [Elysia crispata]